MTVINRVPAPSTDDRGGTSQPQAAQSPRFWISRLSLDRSDATGAFWRHNDGTLNIMAQGTPFNDHPDDARPVLLVPRFTPAKRGEAWKAPDPEQEAFAQQIADLLCATFPATGGRV